MKKANEICPTTTLGKVNDGALLVDVRRDKEVQDITYDVPNYLHIPLHELEKRIAEIPKDKELVMACRSGMRSLKATYFLMNNGYENISNMEGGILKWAAKDLPVKGDREGLLTTASCDCSQPDCC